MTLPLRPDASGPARLVLAAVALLVAGLALAQAEAEVGMAGHFGRNGSSRSAAPMRAVFVPPPGMLRTASANPANPGR